MASLIGLSERLCRWLADAAGFSVLEESGIRAALKKMVYLSAGAWLLGLLSLAGLISPIAGLFLMSAVALVLVGAVLVGAHIQNELAQIAMKATSQPAPPTPALPELDALGLLAASNPGSDVASSVQVPVKQPAARIQTRTVLHTGQVEGRDYSVFTDGSIEIDTAFGRRWFESVDHAHEFIGIGRGHALKNGRIELASVA